MTAKDLLGVIVRIFGLILIVWGGYSLIFAGLESTGLIPAGHQPITILLSGGVLYVASGVLIVRKAQAIENFCYRQNKKP
jgi:hypothetical protein